MCVLLHCRSGRNRKNAVAKLKGLKRFWIFSTPECPFGLNAIFGCVRASSWMEMQRKRAINNTWTRRFELKLSWWRMICEHLMRHKPRKPFFDFNSVCFHAIWAIVENDIDPENEGPHTNSMGCVHMCIIIILARRRRDALWKFLVSKPFPLHAIYSLFQCCFRFENSATTLDYHNKMHVKSLINEGGNKIVVGIRAKTAGLASSNEIILSDRLPYWAWATAYRNYSLMSINKLISNLNPICIKCVESKSNKCFD